jgi:hypothetical protein
VVLESFFLGLALNCNLPNHCLLSNWDCMHGLLSPAHINNI